MARRQPTHDDANLILDLYEARREETLRRARDWFMHHFHASTIDEFQALCPPGSESHAYFRMVVSYWDMAASLVASGVLEPVLFFKSSREMLFVWERIRAVVPALRAARRDDRAWHNLEDVAHAFAAWLDEHAPGVYERYVENLRATWKQQASTKDA